MTRLHNYTINELTKNQIKNIMFQATIMWRKYFTEKNTQYSLTYKLMGKNEQKSTIKMLTQVYIEYKYNPPIQDEETTMVLYPYYKYTNNKEESNLISLCLNNVFAL